MDTLGYNELTRGVYHDQEHRPRKDRPRDQAQYEEQQADGRYLNTRRAVSDHLSLELNLLLREPVRTYSELEFHITEWDAKEHGGIAETHPITTPPFARFPIPCQTPLSGIG
jgi:hypothetical protein